jgi:predicted metal-dependent phosphoesterase TrpH
VGLDRIALTDHDTAAGALLLAGLEPGLTIVGEEVRTSEGDLIGLFLSRGIEPGGRPEEVMDAIHAQGGLTYLAHPLDRHRVGYSPERIVELAPRVDIIETYNAWSRPEANRAAARLAQDLGRVAATGSDAHSVRELGWSWMEIDEYGDPEEFLERLRRARHVVTAASGRGRRA